MPNVNLFHHIRVYSIASIYDTNIIIWFKMSLECNARVCGVSFLGRKECDVIRVRVKSYFKTGGLPPISSSWRRALWDSQPDLFPQLNTCGHSPYTDERMGLSFTTAAGPRQCIHSRVRVPWDSRPYVTVSDSRLPFLSPPTTRRAMVEVFDPASTREDVISW
jgi:hypothetical protein